MFPTGIVRTIDAESHAGFRRYAGGDCEQVLWRLHDFLELSMGDRKNAGGLRMASRDNLCRCERSGWIVVVDRGNSAGKQNLGGEARGGAFTGGGRRMKKSKE